MTHRARHRGMPCPMCGYDLRGSISAGIRTCPECGWKFNDEDVAKLFRVPDPDSQPPRLRPDERRVSGRQLLIFGAFLVLMTTFLLIVVSGLIF